MVLKQHDLRGVRVLLQIYCSTAIFSYFQKITPSFLKENLIYFLSIIILRNLLLKVIVFYLFCTFPPHHFPHCSFLSLYSSLISNECVHLLCILTIHSIDKWIDGIRFSFHMYVHIPTRRDILPMVPSYAYVCYAWVKHFISPVIHSFELTTNGRKFICFSQQKPRKVSDGGIQMSGREENTLATVPIISLVFFLPPSEKLKRFKVQLILKINTVSCSLTRPMKASRCFEFLMRTKWIFWCKRKLLK